MKRAFVSLLFGAVAFAADAPTSWTPEFSMKFQTIGPVVPSHDGSWVAWTQTRSVMDTEKSEEVTQIFIAKADGSFMIGSCSVTRCPRSTETNRGCVDAVCEDRRLNHPWLPLIFSSKSAATSSV